MLQYASQVASSKSGSDPKEGSVESALLFADELDEDDSAAELADILEQLFDDAKVPFARTNRHGDEYSIIAESVREFIHWHDMPWE